MPMERDHGPASESRVPIRRAAQILGVSTSTLRRWESEGKITPERTPANHRVYRIDTLTALLSPADALAVKTGAR